MQETVTNLRPKNISHDGRLFQFNERAYSLNPVGYESILYPNGDDESLSVVSLNATGTFVVQACIVGMSPCETAEAFSTFFNIEKEEALVDINKCLDSLVDLQVVICNG